MSRSEDWWWSQLLVQIFCDVAFTITLSDEWVCNWIIYHSIFSGCGFADVCKAFASLRRKYTDLSVGINFDVVCGCFDVLQVRLSMSKLAARLGWWECDGLLFEDCENVTRCESEGLKIKCFSSFCLPFFGLICFRIHVVLILFLKTWRYVVSFPDLLSHVFATRLIRPCHEES